MNKMVGNIQFERNEEWRKEIEAFNKALSKSARSDGRQDVYTAIEEVWSSIGLYKYDMQAWDFIQTLKTYIAKKELNGKA